VTYNDPRRFGFMLLLSAKELDQHHCSHNWDGAVDPAMNAETLARPCEAARPRSKPLLDQNHCGLGNIYVCEALHAPGFRRYEALEPRRGSGKPLRS